MIRVIITIMLSCDVNKAFNQLNRKAVVASTLRRFISIRLTEDEIAEKEYSIGWGVVTVFPAKQATTYLLIHASPEEKVDKNLVNDISDLIKLRVGLTATKSGFPAGIKIKTKIHDVCEFHE